MGSVSVKEGIPVGIRPPSLTHRSHLGWLGHIGHGVVSLSQLVLNPVKGAEGVVWCWTTVHTVTVPLSPGLEEDRQGADIGIPHRLCKSQHVGNDVVVHILGTEAWPLALILENNRVPVSVLDPVQAVGCMPLECLTPRRTSFCGCGEACALGDHTNQEVQCNAASAVCVAVAKEKNVLVGAVVSRLTLLRESRLLYDTEIGSKSGHGINWTHRVGAGKSGTGVSVCWAI